MSENHEPYLTDHLRRLRDQGLNQSRAETVDLVARDGSQVWNIKADEVCPRFSYTVGIYETSGHPEIVTIGLPAGTAQYAFNEAARLFREGVDLTVGRHGDLISNVDVEFRPASPAWLHQIMLRASWLYGGEDVPVLQLIYPDLGNVFPDEPGFNEYFAQPDLSRLLDGQESAAQDLWAAYDDSTIFSRWKFPTGPHTSAYLSETVHQGTEPVVFVSHDQDGDWQFLGDSMKDGGGPVIVCLHHPIEADSSLEALFDLPQGWYAERATPTDSWVRQQRPPDEEEGTDEAQA